MEVSTRTVSPEELSQHTSKDSCWLLIDGCVYDVTGFRHPGGFNRLLELAGQDATKAFADIRHSEHAHAHLKRLLVGRLQTGQDNQRNSSPTEGYSPSSRLLARVARAPTRLKNQPLTGGSHHRATKDGEPFWSTRCRGFLPVRDPPAVLEPPYDILCTLVADIPVMLSEGTFREHVEAHASNFAAVEEAMRHETRLDVLERVHALYGYIGKGYVHGLLAPCGAHVVPEFLASGWLAVSEMLQREPTIDYADCVLCNWERIDKSAGLTPDNIRILCRFTGLLDEEWFLKTHVIIESEASGVVSAIYDGFKAVASGSVYKLLAALSWLEQAMSHVASNCLRIMFDRSGDDGSLCEPELFFHRLRPFISTWTALFEGHYDSDDKLGTLRSQLRMLEALSSDVPGLPDLHDHRKHLHAAIADLQKRRKLCGASGAMSTLLPCCDAFLGVKMSSPELGAMLSKFEEYMPSAHREFLSAVRRHSARDFVLQMRADGDPQADTLIDHFNACVRRVLDFRWRHLSYIEQYVLRPSGSGGAQGTGGTPAFSYLNQHINDTEAAMLSWTELPLSPEGGPLSPHASDECIEPLQLDHVRGLDIWEVTHEHGLLPSEVPVDWAAIGAEWEPVRQLVRLLPGACVPPASFRNLVLARLDELPPSCAALSRQETRERARGLLAFLVAGWHSAGDELPLPAPLHRLFTEVSALLERSARLGLTDWVLYNWNVDLATRDAYSGPAAVVEPPHEHEHSADADRQARLGIAAMETVQPMQRFVCVEEENWFCRLHVTLASGMGGVVSAINRCVFAQSVTEQVRALQLLEHAIEALVKVHYAAGIGNTVGISVPKNWPLLLMQRLHRFLPHAPELGLEPIELRAVRVFCAGGIDQACMMHVLGVAKGTNAIARFRDWQLQDLPVAHRKYLEQLLSRVSIREQVEREVGTRKLTVQQLAHLELAHNSCIDMLLRFSTRRWELV